MKKRPDTDWEIIIKDAENDSQLRRDLEEVIKHE